MCGRSSLTVTEKELEERFHAGFYSDDLIRYNPLPNWNAAPTHMMPVITMKDQEHINVYRWGLIPFWSKDEKIGAKMINARVETVLEKSSFKKCVETRRCLVPIDGFYEWKRNGKVKIPYRIESTHSNIMSLAGLYDKWSHPEKGDIHSFTVITMHPNKKMEEVHNRMPAILLPEQEKVWLDHHLNPQDAIELITQYPDDYLRIFKVSPEVNSVRNNHEGLSKPYVEPPKNELF